MRFVRAFAALAALTALLVNCDGPTDAGPADITGTWGGIISVFQDLRDSIAFTVVQAPDGGVSGTGVEHFLGIEIPLTVSGRVDGPAVTLSFADSAGLRPADPAMFTGTANANEIRGTYTVGPFPNSVTFRRIR